MIQNQRYCLDVMNQIEAITAALRRVEGDMLRDHIAAVSRTAVSGRLKDSDCEHLADEIADLVKRRT